MSTEALKQKMTPRLLTVAIVLLALVAIFQLAILLQRQLSRPFKTPPAPPPRVIAWNPEDEISAMHARINQMFNQAFTAPFFAHPPATSVSPRIAVGQAGSFQGDPFAHLRLMQQRIDALFANTISSRPPSSGFDEGWARLEITPGFNVRDRGDTYDITVQLPGVNKSDIHIQWAPPVLALTVEQNLEQKSQGRDGSLRQSQRTSRFERHLRLPGAASRQDAVKASFSNEVLRIMVPKEVQPETPAQSIPIH